MVVLASNDGNTAERHHQLATSGIDAAYREGNLRLSLHLFNAPEQIDQVLQVLHAPLKAARGSG